MFDMQTPVPATSSSRLYALLLHMRPREGGHTLMPFSGDLVHAAFLNWMHSSAPEVAAWLHEGNKRRLFTCSSLQFPLPPTRMREAEKKNIHLPLQAEKKYTVRITLLLDELFPLLYEAFMRFDMHSSAGQRQPFMQLGKQSLLLQEVIVTDDASSWCGSTTLDTLIKEVQALPVVHIHPLTLEFSSLTTFNRSNQRTKIYGNHYAMVPLPLYIFPMLANRWCEFAPPEYAKMIQRERIEQYILDDGMIIYDYDLQTHWVTFTNHPQRGFVGTCTYHLYQSKDPITPEAPLTIRQQILLLARFAFYSGIGYKTAMGMGQTRILPGGSPHA
jgi:CRISPR-associated endoribonuclease Cas6